MSGRIGSTRSSHFHYLVYIDGNKTCDHYGDPLAAIHTAEQAMAADPEHEVAIVVLDDEQAGMSDSEFAVRPFVTHPDDQAAQAVLQARAETEREPGATGSGAATQSAAPTGTTSGLSTRADTGAGTLVSSRSASAPEPNTEGACRMTPVLDAIERARQAWEKNEKRTDVQLRLVPTPVANNDLHDSLTRVIDELEATATKGVSLTPEMTRHVTATLRIILACHTSLARFEQEIVTNVVPITVVPDNGEFSTRFD